MTTSEEDRRPATLVHAAAATFATNGATVAFALLNVLILARALGPTGRGEVAFVIAVWVLAAGLATLGLEEANGNLGGRHPERRAALATNSVVASLVLGVVGASVIGLLLTLVPGTRGEVDLGLLLLALATLPSGLLGQNLKFLLQSDYRFGITNLALLASPAITALCNGILALTGTLTVELVIVVFVATNVIATLILVVSVARHFGFGRPDVALARESLSFGLKSHLSRLLELGTYRGDQWLLGVLAGPYEVGLYSIAISLAEALFYISGIIALVQRPHLVRALPAEAAEFGVRIFRRAVVLSAAVGIALFVAAPTLCVGLFGASFASSGDDLRLLSLAAVGVLAVDLFNCLVIAQRRPLLASVGGAATLSAMVVLNLVLVPDMGGTGAAIAKSAAFTAGGVTMVVIVLRVFKADPRALIPGREDVAWYRRKLREGMLGARAAMRGWRASHGRLRS
jgi:O-antigen/teichoic acid export membrane protein